MSIIDKSKYLHSDINQISINSQLDEIEALLGRLDPTKKEIAENILERMDLIDLQINANNKIENNQKSYDIQLEYIHKRILSHAGMIIKAIGGVDEYQSKRKIRKTHESAWWWYLDQWLNEKRRKQIIRASIFSALIVIVLVVLGGLYNRYLAPSPEVRARLQYENTAGSLADTGDFRGAILELNKAIAFAPEDMQLRVQKGVFHLKLAEYDEAEEEFKIAKEISGDPYLFYLERAYIEIQAELYNEAELDTKEMLKYKSDSAEAYLLNGQIFEKNGELDAAMEAYEKAAQYAEEQDNAEIITTVRLRMAFLMQSIAIPTAPQ